MAGIFCCSALCGVVAQGTSSTQRHWDGVGAATPTIETSVVPPSCAACYKFTAAAALGHVNRNVSDTTLSGGLWWRYTGTPDNTTHPVVLVNASGNSVVRMTTAGLLQAVAGAGGPTSGPTLSADTWYWITWKHNSAGATTTVTARVYDSSGTAVGSEFSGSNTQASAPITNIRHGMLSTATATLYVGGIYHDDDDTTYPHLPKKVVRLTPTGDGTHSVGAGTFQTNTGAAITGATTTAHSSLPTTTVVGSTPHVRQTASDTSAYLEFTFSGAPSGGTADVLTFVANLLSQGTGAHTQKYTINDNGTVVDALAAADFSQTTDSYPTKAYAVRPSNSAAWTESAINAVRARWGYGGAFPDNAVLGGLMIEAAFVIVVAITGTGAITGNAPTVVGAGAEVFTGTGAVVGNAPTVAGVAAEVFTGSGAVVGNAPTVVGSGAEVFTGTGTLVGNAPTVAGTAAEVFTGTGAVVGSAPVVEGAGWTTVTGTGVIVGEPPAVTGTGAEIFEGTGAIVGTAPTVVGAGAEIFEGSGAIVGEPPVIAGTGTSTFTITGTGSITGAAPVVEGAGVEIFQGAGAIVGTAPTVVGAGAEIFTGTGQIVGQAPAVAGEGNVASAITGTGAITGPAATVSGVGTVIANITGTGAIVGAAPVVVGIGTASQSVTGTGAIVGTAPTVAGVGREVFAGTGAIVGQSPTVVGAGAEVFTGTGQIVAPAGQTAGVGVESMVGSGAIIGPGPHFWAVGIGGVIVHHRGGPLSEQARSGNVEASTEHRGMIISGASRRGTLSSE